MKELKHIKTIDTINKIIDLKKQKRDTVKELRNAVEYEKSKYCIRKAEKSFPSSIAKYHLIDTSNPSYPVLYEESPDRIKSYLRLRNVDINTIQGKELIFDKSEYNDDSEYEAYDKLIDNIEDSLKLYAELRDSVDYEYATYILGKSTTGRMQYFRLADKESGDILADGLPEDINRYINRHNIDRDQIFGISLLQKLYRLAPYYDGNVKGFKLINKETENIVIKGKKKDIEDYIRTHNIERDGITNISALTKKN